MRSLHRSAVLALAQPTVDEPDEFLATISVRTVRLS
jgi:hypothetical protein